MELFDDSEVTSLSPKDQWKKKHGIQTKQDELSEDWTAWKGDDLTTGHTEQQALLKLARRLKLTFYDHNLGVGE